MHTSVSYIHFKMGHALEGKLRKKEHFVITVPEFRIQ